MTKTKNDPAARDFAITREFDVPRELMFELWTQTEHLNRWFGPKGVTIVSAKNDLRPGGLFHYGMRTDDGTVMWGKRIYREIVPPARLVFIVSFSDEQGGVTRHPVNADWPLETVSTVIFAEHDERTVVTIQWAPHNASESERKAFDNSRDEMKRGWTGTLDQLAAYLTKL